MPIRVFISSLRNTLIARVTLLAARQHQQNGCYHYYISQYVMFHNLVLNNICKGSQKLLKNRSSSSFLTSFDDIFSCNAAEGCLSQPNDLY